MDGSYPRNFLEYVGYPENLIQKILCVRKCRQSFNEVLETVSSPTGKTSVKQYFRDHKPIHDMSREKHRNVLTIYRHLEESKQLFQTPKVYRFILNGEKNYQNFQTVFPERNREEEQEIEDASVFKSQTVWIEDLDTTYRTKDFLKNLGLYTAKDVLKVTPEEYVLYKQMTMHTYCEIAEIAELCHVKFPDYQTIYERFYKRISWKNEINWSNKKQEEKIL